MRVLLSGGGVPGLVAFAGACGGLRAAGLDVSEWAGVSAGAIVAACEAANVDTGGIVRAAASRGLLTLSPGLRPTPHLYHAARVRALLRRVLPLEMGAVGRPLHIVTADLTRRKQVIWRSTETPRAPLEPIVSASMAVPGALPAVPLWAGYHADGGLTSNVPANDVWPGLPCLVLRAGRGGPTAGPEDGIGAWAEAVIETVMGETEREDVSPWARVLTIPAPGGLLDTPTKEQTQALYQGGFHAIIKAADFIRGLQPAPDSGRYP